MLSTFSEMNVVGIFYPSAFLSYSKFSRKIKHFLSHLNNFQIVYETDGNNYIRKFADETQLSQLPKQIHCWKESPLTHAVVFDDKDTHSSLSAALESNQIICRKVFVGITTVINIKKTPEYLGIKSTPSFEYIGRGSYWGNPYSMLEKDENRAQVIRKYKYDFDHDLFPNKKKNELHKLVGKKLGCFCKPEACHGDILAEYLNGYDDGK